MRNKEAVVNTINSLDNTKINLLINNTGLVSGVNKIQDGLLDDWYRMINTNMKGLLNVSWKTIPLMIENKSCHIINIGSTAQANSFYIDRK